MSGRNEVEEPRPSPRDTHERPPGYCGMTEKDTEATSRGEPYEATCGQDRSTYLFGNFAETEHRWRPKVWRAAGCTLETLTKTIAHNSRAKRAWDWFIATAILYTSIIVPFEAAFITSESARQSNGGDNMQSLAVVDQTICAIFAIDMALTFRTTFVDERGMTECRLKEIALRYLKGWFFIDVLSVAPLDTVFFVMNTDKTAYAAGLLKTVRLPRLLQIGERFSSIAINGTAVLSLLIGVFVICCHWLGCLFYALAMAERPYLPEPKMGWVDALAESMNRPINDTDPTSGPDIRQRYLASFDFAISCVTNIGLGNTSPNTNLEKIFSIFMMLIGSLLYTIVIRNVNSLAAAYGSHGAFRKHKKVLSEFSSFHRLPRQLTSRLKGSFRKAWSLTQGHSVEENLRGFPDYLLAEVAIHINRRVWQKFDFFKGVEPACLREVAVRMVAMRVPEGHFVLHRGEAVDGVFLVVRGTLKVCYNGHFVTTLGPGNAMCQNYDLCTSLDLSYSIYDVVASSYCDLRKIPRKAIGYFTQYHPGLAQALKDFLKSSFVLRHTASFNQSDSTCEILPPTAPEVIGDTPSAATSLIGSNNSSKSSLNARTAPARHSADEADVHGLRSRSSATSTANEESLYKLQTGGERHAEGGVKQMLCDGVRRCCNCDELDIRSKLDLLKSRLTEMERNAIQSMEQVMRLLGESSRSSTTLT